MSSPQAFVDRALQAGYSKEEISRFLQQAGPMKNKERQAMEILRRSPENLDPESKRIAGEAAGSMSEQSGISGTMGNIAKAAVPIAAGFAAGGPILKAAGAALGGAGVSGLGDVLSRPTGKDAVSLFNTYRKRGLGHTLAQFGSQQAKKFSQGGGEVTQSEEIEMPEPIASIAQEQLKEFQDPIRAGQQTAFILAYQQPNLLNLGRTYAKKVGLPMEEAFAQFLQGNAQGEAQQANSLSDLSDSDLLSLAKKMGLM